MTDDMDKLVKGDLESDVAAWALERLTATRIMLDDLRAKGIS